LVQPYSIVPDALPYQPIDCSFYDRIEAAAVRRAPVVLRHHDVEGSEVETKGRVADVFSRGGAEYMRMAEGREIRLDRILALDGVAVPSSDGDAPTSCAR
jgi:Rho-binding antiterminator